MFAPALQFLDELKLNNNREWFEAHKARYESDVRRPAQRLVERMAPRLAARSPHLRAIASGAGSSVSRIHRDTRFSADKSPYKDYLGIHFAHASGKEAPGAHVHIARGDTGVGLGMWMLEPEPLQQVRQAIVAPGSSWAAARVSLTGGGCRFIGEQLKRVPKGYAEEHPFAEDLRRKGFGCTLAVDPTLAEAEFVDAVDEAVGRGWPLMIFLCGALGLPL